ncbi:Uncharacterized protein TOPH_06256 [Tolypocladium ophioglossoides CBS 100239]|uniref:YMC020W-like alpha/beta hydrolase domain-containing protein n=1 Tax=Tolypocladium ophioglossoides (strain CBS 100239) TaxID=1163406 RepID=A0A0L0N4P8_TOLOC|nr:Uncharacterized protein TOPH_06256 [Tolypocladium ophioglossoides CBS 100239]
MLPRKRQRPNPAEAGASSLPIAAGSRQVVTSLGASASNLGLGEQQQQQQQQQHMPPPLPADRSAVPAETSDQKQVRKAKSWYGSWPRTPNKASASTSVARENILGGTVRSRGAPGLSRFDPKKGDETASLSSARTKSLSKVPEDVMPELATDDTVGANNTAKEDDRLLGPKSVEDDKTEDNKAQDNTAKDPTTEEPAAHEPSNPQRQAPPSGWLGWWSKTPFTETQAGSTPNPTSQAENEPNELPPSAPPTQTEPEPPAPTEPPSSAPAPASSSWFGFLSLASNATMKPDLTMNTEPEEAPGKEPEDVVMKDAPSPPLSSQIREAAPKAGSTWTFWSKDAPKTDGKVVEPESGEIAVMGEGSEAHPKPMTEGDVSGTPSKDAKGEVKPKEGRSTWRKSKRPRPASLEVDPQTPSPLNGSTAGANTTSELPVSQPETEVKVPSTKSDTSIKPVAESQASTTLPPNLLLPSFPSTYHMKENTSILQQIANFLLRTAQPPTHHVFRVKDPPPVRKAIAIGIHGLFPATYLRPMIGQPTGTSLRFASLAADAIRRWADAHGCPDCAIEKVALEGDGRISERVDNLWKLMLNWIDHIRSADLVILASHSQGVPVSIMLLEKLIDLGIITDAKIGVCAMAGVALGPFPDYKSSILMGSAAELWEFGNPQSGNSLRFEAALKRVLDCGARVTFIGSIDDQLVPMESAVYSPASHPYIYRAVFINGRVHAPDFIAYLVGFALKLRNLGVADHGLIRELSLPLAGSLYSGEGHSRLYYDAAVYDLAVAHALETTAPSAGSKPLPPCHVAVHKKDGLASPNPYVLPWIMRGMLEEDFVRTELSAETDELLRQFDDWKPANKALKDVKYRLEAVRSKL